jgi:hypothetical protein
LAPGLHGTLLFLQVLALASLASQPSSTGLLTLFHRRILPTRRASEMTGNHLPDDAVREYPPDVD